MKKSMIESIVRKTFKGLVPYENCNVRVLRDVTFTGKTFKFRADGTFEAIAPYTGDEDLENDLIALEEYVKETAEREKEELKGGFEEVAHRIYDVWSRYLRGNSPYSQDPDNPPKFHRRWMGENFFFTTGCAIIPISSRDFTNKGLKADLEAFEAWCEKKLS